MLHFRPILKQKYNESQEVTLMNKFTTLELKPGTRNDGWDTMMFPTFVLVLLEWAMRAL